MKPNFSALSNFSLLALCVGLLFLVACAPSYNEEWLIGQSDEITTLLDTTAFFIPTDDYFRLKKERLNYFRAGFQRVDTLGLSASALVDFQIWGEELERMHQHFELDTIDRWDASYYNFIKFLKPLATRLSSDAPAADKVIALVEQSDSFYYYTKTRLSAIDLKSGKIAIQQHLADYNWLQNDFKDIVDNSSLNETSKNAIREQTDELSLAIKDYIGYINSLINNADDQTHATATVNN